MHKMRRANLFIFCIFIFGCAETSYDAEANQISESIWQHYEQSGMKSVNLSDAYPESWDQVCIVGPFASIKDLSQKKDFEWNRNESFEIETDSGKSRLVFISGREVKAYVVHPRNHGDFSYESGQCFPRAKSNFKYARLRQGNPYYGLLSD